MTKKESTKKVKKSYFEMKEINDMQSHYNNTKGILICHAMNRERGSKKEMFDLLDQFAITEENNQNNQTIENERNEKNEKKIEDDLDAQLAQELAQLAERKQKWYIHDTGVNCMMFCEVHSDAIETVKNVFEGAKNSEIFIKETQKIFPLQKVGIANAMEKVTGIVKEILNEMTEDKSIEKYKSFAIRYACRHNSNFTRDETIKNVAEIMPKEWKVDLKNPDVTVFIEIFYRGVGVSFIDQETLVKYANFNIGKFLKGE